MTEPTNEDKFIADAIQLAAFFEIKPTDYQIDRIMDALKSAYSEGEARGREESDSTWRIALKVERKASMAEGMRRAAEIVEAFQPIRGLNYSIEKHDEGMREILVSNILAAAEELEKGK